MSNDLKEKIITISEPTNLDPNDTKPINFKDENGDRYTLWKTNQQGISIAYESFKKLEAGGAGQAVGIVFKEEPGSYVDKRGETRNITNRTIVKLKQPSDVRVENQTPNYAQPEPRVHPEPSQSVSQPIEDDKARGMVRNTVAKEFIKKNDKLTDEVVHDMEPWVEWIMTGMRPSIKVGKTNREVAMEAKDNFPIENAPVGDLPKEEEVIVSQIPF